LSLKSDDVKALANALNIELDGGKGAYRTLDTTVTLTSENKATRAKIESFRFDDISATGDALINMSDATPYIEANFDIPVLDLGPYLPESESGKKAGDPTDGWSTEQIDLSVLKSANGSFDLSIGRLANQRAEILDVEFKGKLRNGSLNGTLFSKAPETGRATQSSLLNPLYEGDLETNFVVASQPDKSNRLSFTAEGSGIAASDLVKFFTGQDVLRGVASLNAAAKTNGNSIADFVQNLSGTYTADVADGALFNINLAQLFRTASELRSSNQFSLSPEQETDFSSLKLQGDIESGTANIELFRLLSPVLRAEATGSVDLFNQSLDIRIVPRATAASGQKLAGVDIGQIGVPVRIRNSWQSPSVSLDMDYYSQLIANEAQTRIEDELKDRLGVGAEDPVSGILGGILGDRNDTEKSKVEENDQVDEETPENKEEKPEDVAEDILKGIIFGDKKKN
jgi:AsmA protein